MAKDPVCGVIVNEKTASFKSICEMSLYYFDSEKCKAEFDKDPQKFTSEMGMQHRASYYGGYCPSPGCSKPQRGAIWYLYIGVLILIAALFLYSFLRLLI